MTGVGLPVDEVGAFLEPPTVLAEGPPGGPLDGVRVAVKDAIDVAGQVTGAGNPTFALGRAAAAVHAAAVERLLDAGASVVGKTVLDELAYSLAGRNVHHGTPANTAAPGHLTGGSSSGSAAAVAAGEADLGLGTDTGGSIRVPASSCGLFGWRPTHGAVDATGVVPLAPSFDTVGLLARDPVLLGIGAAALLTTPSTGSVGRRVLWAEALDAVDPAVRDAITTGAGPGVELVSLGLDLPRAAEAFRILQAREAWQAHGAWILAEEPDFAPDVAARFQAASEVTDAEVAAARRVQEAVAGRLLRVVADGTVLVLPAAAGPPPPVDVSPEALTAYRVATMALTSPIGLAGLPAVVVPGPTLDGLPLGVASTAARGTDLALIELAAEIA